MEIILKPFIAIYHVVSKILSLPRQIINKRSDAIVPQSNINENFSANTTQFSTSSQTSIQSGSSNVESLALPAENDSSRNKTGKIRRPMKSYRYTIINGVGKKERGTFEAETEEEVRNFLISQDYQVLSITLRPPYDIDIMANSKIKSGDLSFCLTQLSTYIKSGIPLVDSVRILAKQSQKPALKKSFNQLIYELLKGENLSNAMMTQGETYPKLLINMVKTAEMTGDLPSILDDMADYYTSMERTKKQMISAMIYPSVVLVLAFAVLIFMLTYLVPQFSGMFAENDATLPALTLAIIGISDFIKTNYIILIIAIIGIILIFVYLYKKVISFKTMIQTILMHIPVIKNIIIYNEISNFTKTFASLINHGVFITDSM